MGIWNRIATIVLPIFLCYIEFSQCQDGNCTRTNLETVKDILHITQQLLDGKTNVTVSILPEELSQKTFEAKDKHKRRLAVVNNIISLNNMCDSIKNMKNDTLAERARQAVFIKLRNYTGRYLNSANGVDSSNMCETKRVLEVREKVVQNIKLLKELVAPNTNINEAYLTLKKVVFPEIPLNLRTGITGEYPFKKITDDKCMLS